MDQRRMNKMQCKHYVHVYRNNENLFIDSLHLKPFWYQTKCGGRYRSLCFFQSISNINFFSVPFRNKQKFVAVGFSVCSAQRKNEMESTGTFSYGYSNSVTKEFRLFGFSWVATSSVLVP